MVCGLFPVDPLSGEDKYYIFSNGNYKIGRKGIITCKGFGDARDYDSGEVTDFMKEEKKRKQLQRTCLTMRRLESVERLVPFAGFSLEVEVSRRNEMDYFRMNQKKKPLEESLRVVVA